MALTANNLRQPLLILIVGLLAEAQINQEHQHKADDKRNGQPHQQLTGADGALLRRDHLFFKGGGQQEWGFDSHTEEAASSSASAGLWMFSRCMR